MDTNKYFVEDFFLSYLFYHRAVSIHHEAVRQWGSLHGRAILVKQNDQLSGPGAGLAVADDAVIDPDHRHQSLVGSGDKHLLCI
jgi:hypothetical protein